MKMTKRDEAIAVYDRILRLVATLDFAIDDDQRQLVTTWLDEKIKSLRADDDDADTFHTRAALYLMRRAVKGFSK